MAYNQPQIILNNICYDIPDTRVRFDQISYTFHQQRYGIVGDNGSGKTTLLRLLREELTPTSGSLKQQAKIAYCPQLPDYQSQSTVAEIVGVDQQLTALSRIAAGSMAESDYAIVDSNWDIQDRLNTCFIDLGISHINLDRLYHTLSGGERTRIWLAKVILSAADFIMLDEPTNNLDSEARQLLYNHIKTTQQGCLIVSHDRELLRHMEHIIELDSIGIHHYGGNYSFYTEQKATRLAALKHQAEATVLRLEHSKQQVQKRLVQHQKNQKKARLAKQAQITAKGRADKLANHMSKERSEKTNKRIRTQATRQLGQLHDELRSAKAAIPLEQQIDFDLKATSIPTHKQVLVIDQLSFAYPKARLLFENFCLNITGPKRTALCGPNGTGKSTLIKLILTQLKPTHGSIKLGVDAVAYLDQQLSLLDHTKTVLENFQQFQPTCSLTDAYRQLAHFLFKNKDAEKPIHVLSGGERIRAALACVLMAEVPPQLLILDEPTNHLDLNSLTCLETALQHYQGAIMVVSHDQNFLKNIKIDEKIVLARSTNTR